ncbi:SMR family transporter [Puia sp. P3]|uniref:SMR family transporter n=1 Tax=Puia sp. P3 TaxID=3423952 RepID=UPI003D669AA4
MKYIDLPFAIIFNVAGYLVFKQISGVPKDVRWILLFLFGLGLGAVSTYCFTQALRSWNLSTAYPILAAGTCLFNLVFMWMLNKEHITPVNLVGIGLALGGFIL